MNINETSQNQSLNNFIDSSLQWDYDHNTV